MESRETKIEKGILNCQYGSIKRFECGTQEKHYDKNIDNGRRGRGDNSMQSIEDIN